MTIEENQIKETLNAILISLNEWLVANSSNIPLCKKIRNVAFSIYLFSGDNKFLRHKPTISAFPLLETFSINQDYGQKLYQFKLNAAAHLSQLPFDHAELLRKVNEIIEPPDYAELPPEIMMKIMARAQPKDRTALGMASHGLYAISKDDQLWKKQIKKEFGFNEEDISYLSNKSNSTLSTLAKSSNESFKDWYVRIAETEMKCYLLFKRQHFSTPLINSLNDDINILTRGMVFASLRELKQYANANVAGVPLIVEANLPLELIKKRMTDEYPDPYDIARHITRIDSKDVKFKESAFHYTALELLSRR